MSACSGKCCSVFNYPKTPAQLRERWAKWPDTSEQCRDDLFIADMLIPLTADEALERMRQFDVTPPNGFTLETWASQSIEQERGPYTCRHWDPETMLCTVYEERPMMCRDYPYDAPCQHDCNCAYRPDDVVQEFWRKVHAPQNDESPASD